MLRAIWKQILGGNKMLQLITISMLLIVISAAPCRAQAGMDHGNTGTLNLDYFNGTNDPQITWLKGDQYDNHIKPLIYAFGQGDLKRTKAELEYVLARFINHPQALAIAGSFSLQTKNPTWAMPYFEKAISVYPQYAVTHAQYGKYLSDIGMVDKGLEKLKKAAEMDPKLVGAQVWLAAAYAKSGNADLAREAAEKARSLGFKGDLAAYGVR
jgi:tetratricopeptide (TPR) repeat protein